MAKECFDETIKIKPDFADAYWNKSLTQLILGEFKEGWKNYEYRFKLDNAKAPQFINIPRLKNLRNFNFQKMIL